MHLLVAVSLMGKKMAARYDMQEAWRARVQIDDYGVGRLRKGVTRAAASLPSMILWGVAPKDGDTGIVAAGGLVGTAIAVLGLRGLVKLRSWGVVALGGAAALAVVGATFFAPAWAQPDIVYNSSAQLYETASAALGAPLAVVFLVAAVVPFVRPVVRF